MEEINSCRTGREGNGEGGWRGDHEAGVGRWVLPLPCLGGSGASHGGFAVLEAELLLGAGADRGAWLRAGRAPPVPPRHGDGHWVAASCFSPGDEGNVSVWPILHLQLRCFCWSEDVLMANLLQQHGTPMCHPQARHDAEGDLLSHHLLLPQLPSPSRFLRVSSRNSFRRGCIQVLKSKSRFRLLAVTIIVLCPGPHAPTLSPCQSLSPEDVRAGLGAQSEGTLQGRARR